MSAFSACAVPFQSQIYQENYPVKMRGRLVARSGMVKIITGGVAAVAAGAMLNGRISAYPLYIFVVAVAVFFGGYALYQCPATPVQRGRGRELLVGFRALKEERLFRMSIIGWMLAGFASFITLPLRTDYLSSPRFGLSLSEFQVALLVVAVPSFGRLLVMPIWGALFDRFHFTTIRSMANLTALLSIVTFFTSDSLLGLALGSLVQGAAIAGGELTWMLWTTRVAKGDRVASYTSVHTFFTGVRGVVGPTVGFHLLERTSAPFVASVAATLIIASVLVFVIEGRAERARVRAFGEDPAEEQL